MAQQVQVILTSDLSEGPADESLTFGLDGIEYEIDLSKKEAETLRKAMEKYTQVARKMSGKRGKTNTSTTKRSGVPSDAVAIRAWALSNKIDVPARGRIPQTVREQFEAAQGK